MRERYPAGVPCWVDTPQPDAEAGAAFYRGLFGWELENRMPPDAAPYYVATLDGGRVAAVALAEDPAAPAGWSTYIAVESADKASERVRALGGTVISEPFDVSDAGRTAAFADPEGAQFCVWQAGAHTGAEVVNAPGSWNWSDLNTGDLQAAQRFYGSLFGWEFDAVDFGGGPSAMVRMPGYGDFLEQINPGIRTVHSESGAPPGFTDAVAWFQLLSGGGRPHWGVTFSVADADAGAARVAELGGEVLSGPIDVPWSRTAAVRDPAGATFTISQFKPPG